jgi:hypothetical protein
MQSVKELQNILDETKDSMIENTYLQMSNKLLDIYKSITQFYDVTYIETEISRISQLDYKVIAQPKKIILQLNENEVDLITKIIEVNGYFNAHSCSLNEIGKKFFLNSQEIYKDYVCNCDDSDEGYTEINIQNCIVILKIIRL